MGNIIRLSSGGQIQVRTGVLSGVGPQGPRGMVGPPGADGAQGPAGPTGPMGQILRVQSRAVVSSTTSVTANTNTLVAFATVNYDDLGACTSSTAFTIPEIGDYLFTAYVQFNGQGTPLGYRQLWLASQTQGVMMYASQDAVPASETYLNLSVPVRTSVPNEVFNVYARSAETRTIALGALTINRLGSGPKGDKGDQGVPGPVGATGATGAQGPAGSAGTGFATYGDLV